MLDVIVEKLLLKAHLLATHPHSVGVVVDLEQEQDITGLYLLLVVLNKLFDLLLEALEIGLVHASDLHGRYLSLFIHLL